MTKTSYATDWLKRLWKLTKKWKPPMNLLRNKAIFPIKKTKLRLISGSFVLNLFYQENISFIDFSSILNNSISLPFTRKGARYMRDRKSTRLNSSHVRISYAVFCLKKK